MIYISQIGPLTQECTLIPNDPFRLLYTLSSLRRPKMSPSTFITCFFVILGLSAVLVSVNPDWNLIDIVLIWLYVFIFGLLIEWGLRYIVDQREMRMIYRNRHRGDRLYIQNRCAQLLVGRKKYTAQSPDESKKVTVRRRETRQGFAFTITVAESAFTGKLDPDTLLNVYQHLIHTYTIDPAICAITHAVTSDIRLAGEELTMSQGALTTTTVRGYLEMTDIARIREALDGRMMIARVKEH